MSDEFAIQQNINVYSVSATRGDLEAMVATYAPDGVWEVPGIGAHCKGREEILAASQGIVGAIDYMVQMNAPAIIVVDGDTATAQSIIRECGKYAGKDTCLEVLGLYDDKLVRTAEGWRFAKRTFTVRGMHDYQTAPPSLHE
ncbi:MAG: nuclear transport factor 2 family protein [Novosphingobium sp.]|nr:nuclear transport factor 2 family protein [Novosphingobium sp.]